MRPRQSCGRLRRRPWNSAIQRKAAEQFIEFRLIYHAPPGAVRANSAMKALQDEMADDFSRSCYEAAVVALCAQVAAMRGDGASAREQLRRAAENAPNDPLALESYAVFLDRHRDPEARAARSRRGQPATGSEIGDVVRMAVEADPVALHRQTGGGVQPVDVVQAG